MSTWLWIEDMAEKAEQLLNQVLSVRPIPIYRPIISAKTADIIGR